MSDGYNLEDEISRCIGETVTIFTTSGGESGEGFTGIVLSINCNFIRLITQVGPAPGCPLGNTCKNCNHENNEDNNGAGHCKKSDKVRGAGTVTDIPTCRIVAFVHNAI